MVYCAKNTAEAFSEHAAGVPSVRHRHLGMPMGDTSIEARREVALMAFLNVDLDGIVVLELKAKHLCRPYVGTSTPMVSRGKLLP